MQHRVVGDPVVDKRRLYQDCRIVAGELRPVTRDVACGLHICRDEHGGRQRSRPEVGLHSLCGWSAGLSGGVDVDHTV